MTVFANRVSEILLGVQSSHLDIVARQTAVRQAVAKYGIDLPRRFVHEFSGNGTQYYLLTGNSVDVSETIIDSGIDLTNSGASSKLSVKFTTTYSQEIGQINLWLKRTGTTVEGTLRCDLYTVDSNGYPDAIISESADVDIDGVGGAPIGRYARVAFVLDNVYELPAGTYQAVLSPSGYTYSNGVEEVILGVDQSSVTATVYAYSGSAWAVYSTASAGAIEVAGNLAGWSDEISTISRVEYPAATISSNETPQVIDPEEYEVMRVAQGTYLRFIGYSPSTSETIRIEIASSYVWVEAPDSHVDIPERHFEAVCNLAASFACLMLSARYAQRRDATIAADTVEFGSQPDQYLVLSKRFIETYKMLTGQMKEESKAGMVFADIDQPGSSGNDFLFHPRGSR
jgi:hypothetical protein